MATPPILVVGAGPTGLTLALWLARLGATVRIIEKNGGPGLHSRAMAVAARTLEFYQQLGFAEEVVRAGLRMRRFHVREDGKPVATLEFGEFGKGKSAFPFVLSYPQDEHEKLLGRHLHEAGVDVQWNTELLDFTESGSRVEARLRGPKGEERFEATYLAGCDGVHSRVRHVLDLSFDGGVYDQPFFVADVTLVEEEPCPDVRVCLGARSLLLVFPIRSNGHYRLIGIVPPELRQGEVEFEQMRPTLRRLLDIEVSSVTWFSTYHVHHRVAHAFRVGRTFIAGDAGHVHSPAGGQGMNTGIGDAVNLAWKLAAVTADRGAAALLDSYEVERIAFARSLVATTDRAFKAIVGDNLVGRAVRTFLVPHLMPVAMDVQRVRHFMFDLVSQIRIAYPESPLSQGVAGEVRGGDRLPWIEDGHNYAPLASLDWQVHVHGETRPEAPFPVHMFPWSSGAADVGYERDALYLVRPDGYVGVATSQAGEIAAYARRLGLSPR